VRSDVAMRAVQVAVDAALGEVARQQGGITDPIGREARGAGIAAGEMLLRHASMAEEERS
jgi:hypothetical protein